VAGAPWAPEHRLVRIGIKGREVSDASRPAANLVFLLDVSGSMDAPNKLPLVKQSLRLLVGKLRPDDRVAIAVYAGASGLALPSTAAAHQKEILEAIDRLEAEGSTNGEAGIQLAYDIAKANFIPDGVNRVILATDGDFNVGVSSEGELVRLIGEKARSGVFLTVLGFGMGNIKDSTLEQLADKGNGHYAYIDSLAEARKTLVEQAGGTLVTIAKDVKLQVEFNPAVVQAYRLIGYESRLLAREDFNNDRVDAGEIGAGHTVTALYEVVPVGAAMPTAGSVDALKYQTPETPNSKRQIPKSNEMLTVKIRYKDPAGDVSNKLEFVLRDTGARFDEASPDYQFAAAVAAYGMVLRDSPHKGSATLANVLEWGRAGLGSDVGGYRNEFLGLVEQTRQVMQ
jgi:Ca-activated chloride channel family protein